MSGKDEKAGKPGHEAFPFFNPAGQMPPNDKFATDPGEDKKVVSWGELVPLDSLTVAEKMLKLLEQRYDRPGLLVADETITDAHLAAFKVAIDFRNRGPALVFRAVCEDWDEQRIVREVY